MTLPWSKCHLLKILRQLIKYSGNARKQSKGIVWICMFQKNCSCLFVFFFLREKAKKEIINSYNKNEGNTAFSYSLHNPWVWNEKKIVSVWEASRDIWLFQKPRLHLKKKKKKKESKKKKKTKKVIKEIFDIPFIDLKFQRTTMKTW